MSPSGRVEITAAERSTHEEREDRVWKTDLGLSRWWGVMSRAGRSLCVSLAALDE